MVRVGATMLILGLIACSHGESERTAAQPIETAGAEDAVVVAAPPAADSIPAQAIAPCGRNSTEFCECPNGGSALRVCDEGTWADCQCDDANDGFDNDDLAFDD